MRALALAAGLLLAAPSFAQDTVSPLVRATAGGVDAATVDSKISAATAPLATAAALATTDAKIPTPMLAVPPAEAIGGAAGSAGTYRTGTAVQPRITRAAQVVTDASCNFSATWTSALSATPTISLTWVNATPASGAVKCELTADPTTTAAAGRCLREQPSTTLAAVSVVGISVAVGSQTINLNQSATSSCTGIKVHVIALPPAS